MMVLQASDGIFVCEDSDEEYFEEDEEFDPPQEFDEEFDPPQEFDPPPKDGHPLPSPLNFL
jgi:hypothetical protein